MPNDRTAETNGPELLRKTQVRRYLEERLAEATCAADVTEALRRHAVEVHPRGLGGDRVAMPDTVGAGGEGVWP